MVEEQVKTFALRIITERMNYPLNLEGIDDDTSLGPAGINLESLAFVELTLHIQSEYDIVIPDEDLNELAGMTVGQFAKNIVARIAS